MLPAAASDDDNEDDVDGSDNISNDINNYILENNNVDYGFDDIYINFGDDDDDDDADDNDDDDNCNVDDHDDDGDDDDDIENNGSRYLTSY